MKEKSKAVALESKVQGAQNQKHTPGPWTFTTEDDKRYIRSADGKLSMCDMDYYPWIQANDADFCLIASAPELLEALKAQEARTVYPPPFGHDCQWCFQCIDKLREMRRAAIAKAEGR